MLLRNVLLEFFKKHPTKVKFNSHIKEESFEVKMAVLKKKLHSFLGKYTNIYSKLIECLGDEFDVFQFTEYVHNSSYICPRCHQQKKFISIASGFEECQCFKYFDIKTKKNLFEYLNRKDVRATTRLPHLLSELKNDKYFTKRFPELQDINSLEELYLYLTDSKPKQCECCGIKTEFKSFYPRLEYIDKPYAYYKQFCSEKCRDRWWSERQKGESNTIRRMSETALMNMKDHNSKMMKERINKGLFTPNITNSWSRSKIVIKFVKDNQIITRGFRSSWEAYFQLLNPNCEYEQLRIKYFDSVHQQERNYIVDFIDYVNKKVYEIKPLNCVKKRENPDKNEALIKWAKENGFKNYIISEDYFKNNELKSSLLKFTDPEERNKFFIKMKKYYKDFLLVKDMQYED